MAFFKDTLDRTWRVEFDAFVLKDVLDREGIDLADMQAGGLVKVATDAAVLGRVLAVLCADEIKDKGISEREFVKAIRQEAITDGRKAVMAAASDFFPPNEWSEIQSNLTRGRKVLEGMAAIKGMGVDLPELMQLMDAFKNLPPEMRRQIVMEEGGTATNLADLENLISATGPVVTPSNAATDSPVSAAESPPGV